MCIDLSPMPPSIAPFANCPASTADLKQVEALEREVWEVSDRDVVPLALAIASKEAGNLWLGAFDGATLRRLRLSPCFGMEEGRLSHCIRICWPCAVLIVTLI